LIDIGNYLLRYFFNNNVRLVGNRRPDKRISLRQLAEMPEITVSHRTLSNAVSLAVQERELDDPKYKKMSATHKILLSKIDNVELKRRYADGIINNRWSVRALQERLQQDGLMPSRGRRPLEEGRQEGGDIIVELFKPLEKVAKMGVTLEKIDPGKLTREQIKIVEDLKRRLEYLLEQVESATAQTA
jgi:hypothetical protein